MAARQLFRLDLGDRKEVVVGLLGRLTPAQQKDFLTWCIAQTPPIYRGTRIEGELRTAGESWWYFCLLSAEYGLDFDKARLELERRVRAFGKTRSTVRLNVTQLV